MFSQKKARKINSRQSKWQKILQPKLLQAVAVAVAVAVDQVPDVKDYKMNKIKLLIITIVITGSGC